MRQFQYPKKRPVSCLAVAWLGSGVQAGVGRGGAGSGGRGSGAMGEVTSP